MVGMMFRAGVPLLAGTDVRIASADAAIAKLTDGATVLMRGFGSFALVFPQTRTPKVKLKDFRVKSAPRRCPGPR